MIYTVRISLINAVNVVVSTLDVIRDRAVNRTISRAAETKVDVCGKDLSRKGGIPDRVGLLPAPPKDTGNSKTVNLTVGVSSVPVKVHFVLENRGLSVLGEHAKLAH
jgi:hypothetical protein